MILLRVLAVLLSGSLRVYGSTRCNFINYYKASAECARDVELNSGREFLNAIKFHPTAFEVVTDSLGMFDQGKALLERQSAKLAEYMGVTGKDAVKLAVEILSTLEPYENYVASDLVHGFEFTKSDLRKLGLPESFSSKENLIKFYGNYFELHCSKTVIEPLVDCMVNWITYNCKEEEDMTSAITRGFAKLGRHYCTGGVWDPKIRSMLNGDLGKAGAEVAKHFGLFKDPNSPYVFNVSQNSKYANPKSVQELVKIGRETCGKMFSSAERSFADITSYVKANSTIGVGVAFQKLQDLGDKFEQCGFETLKKYDPELFKKGAVFAKHLRLVMDHFSLPDMAFSKYFNGGSVSFYNIPLVVAAVLVASRVL